MLDARAFLVSDDSLLLLAVADVIIDGRRFEGVGVERTVAAPFPIVYASRRDPQLDMAVTILAGSLDRVIAVFVCASPLLLHARFRHISEAPPAGRNGRLRIKANSGKRPQGVSPMSMVAMGGRADQESAGIMVRPRRTG